MMKQCLVMFLARTPANFGKGPFLALTSVFLLLINAKLTRVPFPSVNMILKIQPSAASLRYRTEKTYLHTHVIFEMLYIEFVSTPTKAAQVLFSFSAENITNIISRFICLFVSVNHLPHNLLFIQKLHIYS